MNTCLTFHQNQSTVTHRFVYDWFRDVWNTEEVRFCDKWQFDLGFCKSGTLCKSSFTPDIKWSPLISVQKQSTCSHLLGLQRIKPLAARTFIPIMRSPFWLFSGSMRLDHHNIFSPWIIHATFVSLFYNILEIPRVNKVCGFPWRWLRK